MYKSQSQVLKVLTFGLITLLLASCASAGPVATSTQPDTSMSDTPRMSDTPSASETTSKAAGDYIPYASFATSGDKFSDSKVVLFFNAAWCSTCQQARENIEASLGQIPENLVIVVVDFDNSIELRKKYGVTVQHTFIEIDSAGEVLGKWSGSITVDQIVGQLS
jgi:thiol-disulfide isomerase/thioredoxin